MVSELESSSEFQTALSGTCARVRHVIKSDPNNSHRAPSHRGALDFFEIDCLLQDKKRVMTLLGQRQVETRVGVQGQAARITGELAS